MANAAGDDGFSQPDDDEMVAPTRFAYSNGGVLYGYAGWETPADHDDEDD